MDLALDRSTLFFVGAVLSSMCGLAALLLRQVMGPQARGMGRLGAAWLCAGAGASMFVWTFWPAWAREPLGYSLVLIAALLLFDATALMHRRPLPKLPLVVMAGLGALWFGGAPLPRDFSMLSIAVFLGLIAACTAWIIFRHADPGTLAFSRLLGSSYLFFSAASSTGLILRIGQRSEAGLSALDALFFTPAVFSPVLLTLGAVLLVNARLQHWMSHTSSHDALTEILNRRGFFEQAQKALHTWREQGHMALAMMIDADHFKTINDRYGHATGDAVLRHMASTLKEAVEPRGIVGRYGGEEFCAAVPLMPGEHFNDCCDSIRHAVENNPFVQGVLVCKLTVSIGAVVAQTHQPLLSMLQHADRALYAAKHAGRNRAILHDERGRRIEPR